MRSAVPLLFGTRSFARTLAGLFLFELVALAGEWVVHQIEYVIVYGSRFQSVMDRTPHRYYMGGAGTCLLLAGLAVLAAALLILLGRRHMIGHVRSRVPSRFQRLIPRESGRLALRPVLLTAMALAACQIAIYLTQENMEAVYEGLAAPGISVLIAPPHLSVLPLDVIVALCGSILLWSLCVRGTRSRLVLERVCGLALRFAAMWDSGEASGPMPRQAHHTRLLRMARGLRSPPATA